MLEVRHYELTDTTPVRWSAAQDGRLLQVTGGRIWITLEGRSQDRFVRAGQSFELPIGSIAWISAEPTASFTGHAFRVAPAVVAASPEGAHARSPQPVAAVRKPHGTAHHQPMPLPA